MKNRKISTAIAEKVMTGVLTILMAISVTACGSTKEQANPAATEVTEAVVTTETESETATEAKVENERDRGCDGDGNGGAGAVSGEGYEFKWSIFNRPAKQ